MNVDNGSSKAIAKWAPLIISIFALIVSSYNIIAHEWGTIAGHLKYSVVIHDRPNLYNNWHGLIIEADLTIHNSGTLPVRVDRLAAVIQLGSERHIFTSLDTENVAEKSVWNGKVTLSENMSDEKVRIRDQFGIEASRDLVQKYRDRNKDQSEVFLSKELYEQAGELLQQNTEWMRPDTNFFILFLLWINGTSGDPREQHLYQFTMTADQIRYLRDYQLESYKAPRIEGVSDANRFITYFATPHLIEVTEMQTVKAAYESVRDRVMLISR